MAEIHDTLVLDIDQALREVRRLTDALARALESQTLDIDLGSFERDLANAETSLRGMAGEMRATDDAASGAAAAAGRVQTEFAQAEAEANDLTTNVRQAEGETRDLERAADRAGKQFGEAESRAGKLGQSIRGAIAGIGVGLVGVKLLGFFRDSIDAASDLAESQSKANVVFGESIDLVSTFADTAPQALGLTTGKATEMTATFGNLLLTVGLSQEAAAGMSTEIVQLGADLASFNNIEVGDALDKLRAGLAGEAEPLRALGVFLNEASVSAKAAELGLVGLNGEVSDAAKVQARYALIMEQTTTAQGDFARTADGVANKQRILAAEFGNLKEQIGQDLIPAFDAILDNLPEITEALGRLGPAIGALGASIARAAPGIISVITKIVDALGLIEPILRGGLTDAFAAANIQANLEDGADAATALANGLAAAGRGSGSFVTGLAKSIPFLGIFVKETRLSEETLDSFISTAGGTPAETVAAIQAILDLGESSGFTADELAILADKLNSIELQALSDDLLEAKNETIELMKAAKQGADDIVPSLKDAGQALRDAFAGEDVDLSGFDLGPAEEKIATFIRQNEELRELGEPLAEGVANFQAGADAFESATDDMVDSLDEFLTNLTEEIAAQAAFEKNLAILAARGLDSFTAVLEQGAPGAAQVAADAVANPAKALETERTLEGQATAQANTYTETYNAIISESDFTEAQVDNLLDLARSAEDPNVKQALIDAAQLIEATLNGELINGDYTQAGIDAGLGFAAGMISPTVIAALRRAGSHLAFVGSNTLNSEIAAGSPSKLFMDIGENAGNSFVMGLENASKPAFDTSALTRGIPASLRLPGIPAFPAPAIDQSRVQQITVETVINNPVAGDLDTERTRLAQTSAQVAGLLAGTII